MKDTATKGLASFGSRWVGRLGSQISAVALGLIVCLTPGEADAQDTGAADAESAAPDGGRVEGIAAVVGDRPILQSEVEEQVILIASQYQVPPSDTSAVNQLRRDVLGRMIDDHLLYLEGKAMGLEPQAEEIEATIEQAIQENVQAAGGPEAFAAELLRIGATEEMIRQRYREEADRRAVAGMLVQREIQPNIEVTDEGVRTFYEEHKSELPKKPRGVNLQDLFIEVRPDSVVAARTLERAQSIRADVASGKMTFADAATMHSDDPQTRETGGLLPPIRRGELNPELEAIAFALPTGIVSEPIITPFGINLIQVEEKDPAGEWVQARLILFGIQPTRSDIGAAEGRAREARAKVVVEGMDFTEAVRLLSEDPVTKQSDGNLGWISSEALQGEVKTAIVGLAVGEISDPVPGDNGYHVFRLLDEEPAREFEFDEIENELRNLYFQNLVEEELQVFVEKLKAKYYVERRPYYWES